MDDADKVILLSEIVSGCVCELNHGKGQKKPPAIMHLVQPWGYDESDTVAIAVRSITIPICAECAQALQGQAWALLICKSCGSSQWVFRAWSRKIYTEHITWTDACPNCAGATLRVEQDNHERDEL